MNKTLPEADSLSATPWGTHCARLRVKDRIIAVRSVAKDDAVKITVVFKTKRTDLNDRKEAKRPI